MCVRDGGGAVKLDVAHSVAHARQLSRYDITGRRFGSLVAVRRTESHGGKVYWLLKCDCGGFVERRATNLRASFGRQQSCIACHRRRSESARSKQRVGFAQFLLKHWHATGSLYPVTSLDERRVFGEAQLTGPECSTGLADMITDEQPSMAKPSPVFAMTHDEIAREMGVSRERVRQLEASALEKVRMAFVRMATVCERRIGGVQL